MKRACLISLFLFFSVNHGFAQVGYVSNVEAQQRDDGSGLVDISYMLNGVNTLQYHVDVEVSFDAGSKWENIRSRHLEGDLISVAPSGQAKTIVWDGLAGFPEKYSEETKVRVNIRLARVYDHDGNYYPTTVIGNQEWMAKNLRVTTYNNGDPIPTNHSNEQWITLTNGAYAVHPNHFNLNTREKVLDNYGALYNWYAVADNRGICPAGWWVPDNNDWNVLVEYIITNYDFHNNWTSEDPKGIGNALKSCRQLNSPLGGECDTDVYPRWNSGFHYGTDLLGFNAHATGSRSGDNGAVGGGGFNGVFWSATEHSADQGFHRALANSPGFSLVPWGKKFGYSIRCVREIEE
jgi:uncharacterized protein (TIGR02145 family)